MGWQINFLQSQAPQENRMWLQNGCAPQVVLPTFSCGIFTSAIFRVKVHRSIPTTLNSKNFGLKTSGNRYTKLHVTMSFRPIMLQRRKNSQNGLVGIFDRKCLNKLRRKTRWSLQFNLRCVKSWFYYLWNVYNLKTQSYVSTTLRA